MEPNNGVPYSTCVLKVNLGCCKACVVKSEKLLRKVDGVKAVKVDAQKGEVTVTGRVDPVVLIKTVGKMDKKALLLSSSSSGNTQTGGGHHHHDDKTHGGCGGGEHNSDHVCEDFVPQKLYDGESTECKDCHCRSGIPSNNHHQLSSSIHNNSSSSGNNFRPDLGHPCLPRGPIDDHYQPSNRPYPYPPQHYYRDAFMEGPPSRRYPLQHYKDEDDYDFMELGPRRYLGQHMMEPNFTSSRSLYDPDFCHQRPPPPPPLPLYVYDNDYCVARNVPAENNILHTFSDENPTALCRIM